MRPDYNNAVSFVPVDQAARERARRDHDTSLVLEAGAGTGKTTLLVDRVEALVRSGRARLDQVAAVTFTENAATTMKLRLRERLERARAEPALPAEERRRAAEALDGLERAPISTIHALCAAILQERPLECGVTPGFRVADEAGMDLLFAAAWDEWLAERLTTGDPVLLAALEQDIPLESDAGWGERSSLRGLARALVEERDLEPLVGEAELPVESWRIELLDATSQLGRLLAGVPEADALGARLLALQDFSERARFLAGEELLQHLLQLQLVPRNFGHKAHWPSAEALAEARALAAWTGEAQKRWRSQRAAALHGRLVAALQEVARGFERHKRRGGVLDFLDLLLLTRNALRDSAALRRHLRRRFRYVIIDEFQDTDPLQVDIAQRLTAGLPGGLTVVGDAKQSIYRFRRADVTIFRRVSEEAAREPGRAVLQLTQNFRSRPALLRFVNRVFPGLLQASAEAGQVGYEPIAPPPGLPEGPAVLALRFEGETLEGPDLLQAEARALADLLADVAAGRLAVRDPTSGALRPSRAGDVMVLARRLTQVRHLELACERASLRFTLEGGKSFFDRQEVHEVLAVLRAVEDPSDRVSLVAALRSSFLGVSDRDLVQYALAGGRLDLLAPGAPDLPGAGSLLPALGLLAELHRARLSLSPAALLERLYDETRVLAALTLTPRGAPAVANLEKVVTLARQSGELGVLTLRGFARLLEERIAGAREEPDLPATRPGDPDTLRVLSIHKAKGLEAPVVALYDTADDHKVKPDVIPLWEEGRIAVGFRQGCQPPGLAELVEPEERRARAEARRLLYVAATRARDYLVVPRPPSSAKLGAFWRELIAALPPGGDEDVLEVEAATLPDRSAAQARANLRALAAAEGGDAAGTLWDGERAELLRRAAGRRLPPVAVTRAAARVAPPPPAPVAPGRGRDFGRLVHQLLEWIPLSAPEQAAGMAEALAPSFGLDSAAAARAAADVRRVLAMPELERARRAGRVWRELQLWFPEGDELLEGQVDLVFEEDGQLVVLDYKTDQVAEADLLAQAAHHAAQLQLYGRGLAQASGQGVRERLVVFTALGRAVPV